MDFLHFPLLLTLLRVDLLVDSVVFFTVLAIMLGHHQSLFHAFTDRVQFALLCHDCRDSVLVITISDTDVNVYNLAVLLLRVHLESLTDINLFEAFSIISIVIVLDLENIIRFIAVDEEFTSLGEDHDQVIYVYDLLECSALCRLDYLSQGARHVLILFLLLSLGFFWLLTGSVFIFILVFIVILFHVIFSLFTAKHVNLLIFSDKNDPVTLGVYLNGIQLGRVVKLLPIVGLQRVLKV